jgi:spermidine/putrescine transport system permease protein
MWFNFLGVTTAWWTAAIAHTVWIAPITTLIISIQAYGLDESLEEAARDMGATRWQILRKITIPLLLPGMISATCFAVLLSWGNFALSLFTTGADSALPEWLYARMTSGYQPMVPAVGVINVGVAILLVIVLFAIVRWSTRKSRTSASSH